MLKLRIQQLSLTAQDNNPRAPLMIGWIVYGLTVMSLTLIAYLSVPFQ